MTQSAAPDNRIILLTGATGYVGGRLLNELKHQGYQVRCLVRRPEFISHRSSPSTEIVKGDVFAAESLQRAMAGVHTAFFLVHPLAASGPCEENDRFAAANFVHAAEQAQVKRIIYLGRLGKEPGLSSHTSSQQDTGTILRQSTVPVIEFRASVILGSGSLSFEMVRALVERLPFMPAPRWARTQTQPIAIEDVLAYLIAALDIPLQSSAVFEIGGADITSYEGIMQEYARQRGLKRLIIPLPWLALLLSSFWLSLVTPLYYRIGRWLIEGTKNATPVNDTRARAVFTVRPRGIREAIQRALANEEQECAETRWADASPEYLKSAWDNVCFRTRFTYTREIKLPYPPDKCFTPIKCIGGHTGWYTFNWLWSVRGFIDKLVGGVGSHRGRRNPRCLLPGDTIDFWRIEAAEQGRMLRLFSELKAPGRAWLQFEVNGTGAGSIIRLTSIFDPLDSAGLWYWYIFYPFHVLVFRGMLRGIAKEVRIKHVSSKSS